MRKMVTFALIGGACGAALGLARTRQSAGDLPVNGSTAPTGNNDVALTAAGGAAVGLGVGLMVDRRAKKRAAKRRLTLGSALTAGGLVEAARAARPVIEHAADVARDRAKDATHRVAERARTIDLSDGRVREAITVLT